MMTTILLVEDDVRVSVPVAAWLRRAIPESAVFIAGTVPRAIVVLSTFMIDLIVSDYHLGDPRENGKTLLDWVKRQRPGMEGRFIFLTGDPEAAEPHPHILPKGGPAEYARGYLTALLPEVTV